MLHRVVLAVAFAFGALSALGGLVAVTQGGADAAGAVWAVILGAAIMVAVLLQRSRYRSLAAERTNQCPGPGGGEDSYLEPRFLATNEVFVDPTSGRLMRVFVDPATGERRYRAEA
jgi:hypothetical protein